MFSLNLYKKGEASLNENLKFYCSYEENGTFIDRYSMNKVAEIDNIRSYNLIKLFHS